MEGLTWRCCVLLLVYLMFVSIRESEKTFYCVSTRDARECVAHYFYHLSDLIHTRTYVHSFVAFTDISQMARPSEIMWKPTAS
jgi:hypothetical protein